MPDETFLNQFERETTVVLDSLGTTEAKRDVMVRDAYDDLAMTLGLTYPCIAILAWALRNMGGEATDTANVASLIGYPENAVSSSLDELERKRYMIRVKSEGYVLDVTEETKERIVDHYCYGKLMF